MGILVISGLLIFLFFHSVLEQLVFDSRYYSFLNGWDIVQRFPFGVGLGGYPVYAEEFSHNLFARFYHVNVTLDFLPTAPESDLVHIFGSLGWFLGSIHLLIQGRILWYTYRLAGVMNEFGKTILFYFCFMTFFGISEDSIFSVNYWIFFGIASGIISSLLYRKRANLL